MVSQSAKRISGGKHGNFSLAAALCNVLALFSVTHLSRRSYPLPVLAVFFFIQIQHSSSANIFPNNVHHQYIIYVNGRCNLHPTNYGRVTVCTPLLINPVRKNNQVQGEKFVKEVTNAAGVCPLWDAKRLRGPKMQLNYQVSHEKLLGPGELTFTIQAPC